MGKRGALRANMRWMMGKCHTLVRSRTMGLMRKGLTMGLIRSLIRGLFMMTQMAMRMGLTMLLRKKISRSVMKQMSMRLTCQR